MRARRRAAAGTLRHGGRSVEQTTAEPQTVPQWSLADARRNLPTSFSFKISIDRHPASSDNTPMTTDTLPTTELEEALERAAVGKRDAERMRNAIEELARTREETRTQLGTVDVAVDLIRDARDQ
jgi:hypothetical protein